MHIVMLAFAGPFPEGLSGRVCVEGVGVLKALHGSIWGMRITAFNQLKVLG